MISLKIEFGGGLELLFANQRRYTISIPSHVPSDNCTSSNRDDSMPEAGETKPADITYLIHHMRDNLLKEREELFMEKDTV